MERSEILLKLIEITKNIFENDDVALTEETAAADVEGWDSLTHIQLVVSIEKAFSLRFSSKEIQSWENVKGIVDSIIAKQ